MSDEFIVGETVRLSVSVTAADGETLADPDVLRLKTLRMGDVVQVYLYGTDAMIVRDSIGQFHADIPLPLSGDWYYRWETSGPITGVAEGALKVRSTRFPLS